MDYTQQLTDIQTALSTNNDLLEGIASLLFVGMIIVICHYAYKFFNMFFK